MLHTTTCVFAVFLLLTFQYIQIECFPLNELNETFYRVFKCICSYLIYRIERNGVEWISITLNVVHSEVINACVGILGDSSLLFMMM